MKLGVLSAALADMTMEEMFQYFNKIGVDAVELGAGGFPGKAHVNPAELLKNPGDIDKIGELAKKYNIHIAALACHGNPVHPTKEIAEAYHRDMEEAILVAERLGIKRIVGFSGCPGTDPDGKMPSWVVCAWPDDYPKVLEYQWNDVLIPYWEKMGKYAMDHGIEQIAFEMHPGFCVYNPETCLRLRDAVGPILGANLDPSHLFWQGIDILAAIRTLGDAGALYHFHAKDTKIDAINCAQNGVLDTKNLADERHRSWIFRTIGYGHDMQIWRDIISNLRMVGYDDVISIEHEDALMSPTEGLEKAVAFMKQCLIYQDRGVAFWA